MFHRTAAKVAGYIGIVIGEYLTVVFKGTGDLHLFIHKLYASVVDKGAYYLGRIGYIHDIFIFDGSSQHRAASINAGYIQYTFVDQGGAAIGIKLLIDEQFTA